MSTSIHKKHLAAWALWALLGVCSCGISPQPSPAPGPGVRWQLDLIDLVPDGAETVITGLAGAFTDGPGTLRVADLDDRGAAVEVPLAEDGSFEVRLAGAPTDLYRLHARRGGFEYQFFTDVTAETDLGGPAVAYAASDCARRLRGMAYLRAATDASITASVELTHDCDGPVVIEGATLRRGDGAFRVDQTLFPITVSPGATEYACVTFDAAGLTDASDILFFAIGRETMPRAPVSLFGSLIPPPDDGADGGSGTAGGFIPCPPP